MAHELTSPLRTGVPVLHATDLSRTVRGGFNGRRQPAQTIDCGAAAVNVWTPLWWAPGRQLEHLATRILTFQDRYNDTADPFDWTYTRDDLNDFLKRLNDHDPQPHANPGQPLRPSGGRGGTSSSTPWWWQPSMFAMVLTRPRGPARRR